LGGVELAKASINTLLLIDVKRREDLTKIFKKNNSDPVYSLLEAEATRLQTPDTRKTIPKIFFSIAHPRF
jgi:hypothetical protein